MRNASVARATGGLRHGNDLLGEVSVVPSPGRIQDVSKMPLPARPLSEVALSALVAFVAFSALSAACTPTVRSANEERSVVVVDAPSTTVITEAPPPVVVEPPSARPRLSQVVTLGQGTSEAVYGGAAGGAPPAGPGGGVVVNNNVTIVNGQGGYGGYGGYGYGYGGTGYGGRSGTGYGGRDTYGRGSSTGGQAWAPNGWEGAGRTAAPGHTPSVGGNWAPAPSHGPKQMK
jgi:hypothetical protein